MAKTIKRPTTAKRTNPAVGFQPDPRREQIFELYRDLGAGRSFRKLQEAVSVRWPANPISLGSISSWSAKFEWQKKIEEYELGQAREARRAAAQNPQTPNTNNQGGSADDVSNLKQAASQALARALQGINVAITKPGDVKALIDMASKAMELADKLQNERTGVATSQEIADFGGKLLDRIVEARRKDIVTMIKAVVEAACAEAGTTNLLPVLKKGAAAVGLRVNDEGEFDGDPSVDSVAGGGDVGIAALGDDDVATSQSEVETKKNDTATAVAETALDIDEVLRNLRGE